MEWNKVLSWEIDNFSKRNDDMKSDPFSSGGCKWCLYVFPNGNDHASDHLSVHLGDVNYKKLRRGWKRIISFYFLLLDQSGKELFRSPDQGNRILFCVEAPHCGCSTLPLTKLQEKGFLEKNKLTIEVYMKVFEVVNEGKSTENDVLDYKGFHIICSQVGPVRDIFRQHPDFAVDVKPKNLGVKTAYMNLLLGLVETLKKSSQSLSVTELSNAESELNELTEAGFKLDWLNSRLEELSLERKKALSDGTWVQQLEERVKNLELTLSDLNVELDKERIKSAAAAKTRWYSNSERMNVVSMDKESLLLDKECCLLPWCAALQDPVTGSAHCALAHYWSTKMNKCVFLASQASGRGGTLNVHLDKEKQRFLLRGKAVTVMEGCVLV